MDIDEALEIVRRERQVPALHGLVWLASDEDEATVIETDARGTYVETYRLRRYQAWRPPGLGISPAVLHGPCMGRREAGAFDDLWPQWSRELRKGPGSGVSGVWLARCELLGQELEPQCEGFDSLERVWQNLVRSSEERGYRLGVELDALLEPWVVAHRVTLGPA